MQNLHQIQKLFL